MKDSSFPAKIALASLTWILLLQAAASADIATTRVRFIDDCSGEVTGVTTPKGKARLQVDLDNLAPGQAIHLEIRIFPAEQLERSNHKDEVRITKKLKAGQDGRRTFSDVVKLAKGHPLYSVQVVWSQPKQTGRSGSGVSAIYVLRDKRQNFYELQGTAVCAWETPWSIASERYFNASETEGMAISRETRFDDGVSSDKGLDLGINPDGDASTPILSGEPTLLSKTYIKNPLVSSLVASNFGWFFPGWEISRERTEARSIMQSWLLAPGQGGYFAQKLGFRRFPVIEYSLERDGLKCSKWMAVRKGYMDASVPIEGFFVVPDDISGDPGKSREFIERYVPSQNTCGHRDGIDAGDPAYLVPGNASSRSGVLFFYPQQK